MCVIYLVLVHCVSPAVAMWKAYSNVWTSLATVLDRSLRPTPAVPHWTSRSFRSYVVDTSGQKGGSRRGAGRRTPNDAPSASKSVLIRCRMLVSVARESAPEVLFTRLWFSLERLKQRERRACWLCTSTASSPSSSPSFSTPSPPSSSPLSPEKSEALILQVVMCCRRKRIPCRAPSPSSPCTHGTHAVCTRTRRLNRSRLHASRETWLSTPGPVVHSSIAAAAIAPEAGVEPSRR